MYKVERQNDVIVVSSLPMHASTRGVLAGGATAITSVGAWIIALAIPMPDEKAFLSWALAIMALVISTAFVCRAVYRQCTVLNFAKKTIHRHRELAWHTYRKDQREFEPGHTTVEIRAFPVMGGPSQIYRIYLRFIHQPELEVAVMQTACNAKRLANKLRDELGFFEPERDGGR